MGTPRLFAWVAHLRRATETLVRRHADGAGGAGSLGGYLQSYRNFDAQPVSKASWKAVPLGAFAVTVRLVKVWPIVSEQPEKPAGKLGRAAGTLSRLKAWTRGEINQWFRQIQSMHRSTLVLKLQISWLGKLLAHNVALYAPTSRQMPAAQVLARRLGIPVWTDKTWKA